MNKASLIAISHKMGWHFDDNDDDREQRWYFGIKEFIDRYVSFGHEKYRMGSHFYFISLKIEDI